MATSLICTMAYNIRSLGDNFEMIVFQVKMLSFIWPGSLFTFTASLVAKRHTSSLRGSDLGRGPLAFRALCSINRVNQHLYLQPEKRTLNGPGELPLFLPALRGLNVLAGCMVPMVRWYPSGRGSCWRCKQKTSAVPSQKAEDM